MPIFEGERGEEEDTIGTERVLNDGSGSGILDVGVVEVDNKDGGASVGLLLRPSPPFVGEETGVEVVDDTVVVGVLIAKGSPPPTTEAGF